MVWINSLGTVSHSYQFCSLWESSWNPNSQVTSQGLICKQAFLRMAASVFTLFLHKLLFICNNECSHQGLGCRYWLLDSSLTLANYGDGVWENWSVLIWHITCLFNVDESVVEVDRKLMSYEAKWSDIFIFYSCVLQRLYCEPASPHPLYSKVQNNRQSSIEMKFSYLGLWGKDWLKIGILFDFIF